jgi:hypothetical protein
MFVPISFNFGADSVFVSLKIKVRERFFIIIYPQIKS